MLKKLWLVWVVAAAMLFLVMDAAAAVCVEHVALDVAAPETTAKWWCENLGFRIKAKLPAPPYAVFIVNSSGRFAIELYRDPNTPNAPDYQKMSPDKMHIAFVSDDLDGDVRRLIAAGAKMVSRTKNSGNELVMLRDPSGIPIQLAKRAVPLVKTDFGEKNDSKK